MKRGSTLKIILPKKVETIIHTLTEAGYEAYIVGGCVRDSILNRVPQDWDITTSAQPNEIKALFKRTIDTGILHGTVTVMLEKEGFEITTYRIDGKYEDFRHPKEVTFTSDLTEDLRRRDFTINAMAYNAEEGLIDKFGGMKDLEQNMIRCVGNAEERFSEDALRIMRAVRFAAQLGYHIEFSTKAAMIKLAQTLRNISVERIQIELIKLIMSKYPEKIVDAYDLGITKVIMPEFDLMMETEQNNPHHLYNVGMHSVHAMKAAETDKVMRLTMLCHDMGKVHTKTIDENGIDHFYGHAAWSEEITKKLLRRLRFDNDTLYQVTKLVKYHDYDIEINKRGIRRALHHVGEDIFPYLLAVKRADALAQSDYKKAEKLETLQKIEALYEEVKKAEECVCLKTLAVTGADLIALGMKPGKEIGDTLQALLAEVIENPEMNTKECLLSKAEEIIK